MLLHNCAIFISSISWILLNWCRIARDHALSHMAYCSNCPALRLGLGRVPYGATSEVTNSWQQYVGRLDRACQRATCSLQLMLALRVHCSQMHAIGACGYYTVLAAL